MGSGTARRWTEFWARVGNRVAKFSEVWLGVASGNPIQIFSGQEVGENLGLRLFPGITTIRCTWDLRPAAIHFTVDLFLGGGTQAIQTRGISQGVSNPNVTGYTFTDLTPDTEYEVNLTMFQTSPSFLRLEDRLTIRTLQPEYDLTEVVAFTASDLRAVITRDATDVIVLTAGDLEALVVPPTTEVIVFTASSLTTEIVHSVTETIVFAAGLLAAEVRPSVTEVVVLTASPIEVDVVRQVTDVVRAEAGSIVVDVDRQAVETVTLTAGPLVAEPRREATDTISFTASTLTVTITEVVTLATPANVSVTLSPP